MNIVTSTLLSTSYPTINSSHEDAFISMFARLYDESCILADFGDFVGVLKPWEICSKLFGETEIELVYATYNNVDFGWYLHDEKLIAKIKASRKDLSVAEPWPNEEADIDIIKNIYVHNDQIFDTKKARVDSVDERLSEEIRPSEICIGLKNKGVLIRFWSNSVRVGWSATDASCETLVNALLATLRSMTKVPVPEIKKKRTPKLNVVNRSTMGEFYTSAFNLPYNPITPDMLEYSYLIKIRGDEEAAAVDGNTFMQKLFASITESKEVEGDTIYPNKGMYIINGQPGTGKSQFLTELLLALNKTKRPVFYFPPNCIKLLGQPEFLPWMQQHPNAIIIAEDAEAVLRANEKRTDATSNLLNFSDGLMGELMQLTFICTFNCDIEEIDSALLRPGRLQMAGEFLRLPHELVHMAAMTILEDKYKWVFDKSNTENFDTSMSMELNNAQVESDNISTMSLAELYQILIKMNKQNV